jgi:hypothetical protein
MEALATSTSADILLSSIVAATLVVALWVAVGLLLS